MKKSFQVMLVLCVVGLISGASAQVTNFTQSTGPFPSIQAAINDGATTTNDVIQVDASTYSIHEAVVVNKSVTIEGINGTPTITPNSGIGITVAVGGVTLQNLKVANAPAQGIYAANVVDLSLSNVTATNNGLTTIASGISLVNVSGTVTLTTVTATNNTRHGLEIGNGSSSVQVSGGNFSHNGTGSNRSYGGGIMIYADAGKTVSSTTINGALRADSNTTAGIYMFCDSLGHINSTTIGNSGSVNLDDNGTSGSGGAAVLVYGPCNITQITASSTKTVSFATAGLVVVGTNAAGAHSPASTTVSNSTLTGYSTNSPAGTMKVFSGTDTLMCANDVNAKVGNLIDGVSTGFQVEDLLVHKVDDLRLGKFLAPGHTVFVTPNSGSILRGIFVADPITYDTVKVEDGTYAENVVVDKAIALIGQGVNTKINPGSGTTLDVTSTGVTLDSLHIYLYGTFAPTQAPTATNNTFSFLTQVKVFLAGPYSSGSMSTATNSVIPTSQPYSGTPFSYSGGESVGSIPANVVDWILVELRNGTTGDSTTSRRAAFLEDNGTVADTNGTPGVLETVAIPTGYDLSSYIVIKHRNHLAIMSANKVGMPNGTAYDFTTAQSQAYGYISGSPMRDLGSGLAFGMYAGDGNNDGQILTTDFSTWQVAFRAAVVGYSNLDYNMDGQVLTTDFSVWQVSFRLGASTLVP